MTDKTVKLYYFSLCPFSRIARMILEEKRVEYELIVEKYWQRNISLAKINPAYELPVLVDDNNIIADINAVIEFLDDRYPQMPMFYKSLPEQAEQRRIIGWYNRKFYYEVTRYIINEKVIRFFEKRGYPDTKVIRSAKANFEYHFDYLAYLLSKRTWLAGEKFSVCDVVAACQLSVLDYLGEVTWSDESVKNWYAIIKSKPSFRKILNETIVGFTPPEYYTQLDF